MESFKTCSKCGVSKSTGAFYKRPANADGLSGDCKPCRLVRQRRQASWQPGYRRFTMTKHGVPKALKDQILALQGGVCAVCGTAEPGEKGWHLDHCHATNNVRGVLCKHCNLMLGWSKDNVDTLAKGISYLSSGVSYGKTRW